jgi:regulator of sigma D
LNLQPFCCVLVDFLFEFHGPIHSREIQRSGFDSRRLNLQPFCWVLVDFLFEFRGPIHSRKIQRFGFDSRRYQIFPRSSASGTGSTQPRE